MKKLKIITTFSHRPASNDNSAKKKAIIAAQNVPKPRLKPFMNVAPEEQRQ
jgi:hypothetical protein